MRLVLTSVRYADFLAATLKAWRTAIPRARVVVATAPDDLESQRLAVEHQVEFVATDAWFREDPHCHVGGPARFNLGYGQDMAFGFVGDLIDQPEPGEVCLATNPDLYPRGRFPNDSELHLNTIYGAVRYQADSPRVLARYLSGEIASLPLIPPTSGTPRGCFQLFRYRPGLRFGSYPTAGKFDMVFGREQFADRQWLRGFHTVHLGGRDKVNWAGRTLPAWSAA